MWFKWSTFWSGYNFFWDFLTSETATWSSLLPNEKWERLPSDLTWRFSLLTYSSNFTFFKDSAECSTWSPIVKWVSNLLWSIGRPDSTDWLVRETDCPRTLSNPTYSPAICLSKQLAESFEFSYSKRLTESLVQTGRTWAETGLAGLAGRRETSDGNRKI